MFLDTVKADLFRVRGNIKPFSFLYAFFLNRNFRAIFSMRLCQLLASAWWGKLLLPLAKVFHRINCAIASIDLPWELQAGSGFCINHGWGLVINPKAKIGSNVTLFHGVTIGQADKIAEDGSRQTFYPVVGDNVWVGPHAIIVGNVSIGSGARVLGGSVVTKSVSNATMVAGSPAKVIAHDVVPDVMNIPN